MQRIGDSLKANVKESMKSLEGFWAVFEGLIEYRILRGQGNAFEKIKYRTRA